MGDDATSEYINANFVRFPSDTCPVYIAAQAPLASTVTDFWRMIWEHNSSCIVMATDLIENGIERCAEYFPTSVVLDNCFVFGDFQITLKSREANTKYAVSVMDLKHTPTGSGREVHHFWCQWPSDKQSATLPMPDADSCIAMLLEARRCLQVVAANEGTLNGNQG